MNRVREFSTDMGFNAFHNLLMFVIICTIVAMAISWMILFGLFHDETLFDEEYRSEGTD